MDALNNRHAASTMCRKVYRAYIHFATGRHVHALSQPKTNSVFDLTSVPSVVFIGGSEKSRFVGDEMRMQSWRPAMLLQMLEVTAIGSLYAKTTNELKV